MDDIVLKTTNIKGKEYVEVSTRLKYFRANFAGYKLLTDIYSISEKRVIMVASVINSEGIKVATGTAYEDAGNSYINKTSFIENCETSAWGRALANFGIGIDNSVASADEIGAALEQQKKTQQDDAAQSFDAPVQGVDPVHIPLYDLISAGVVSMESGIRGGKNDTNNNVKREKQEASDEDIADFRDSFKKCDTVESLESKRFTLNQFAQTYSISEQQQSYLRATIDYARQRLNALQCIPAHNYDSNVAETLAEICEIFIVNPGDARDYVDKISDSHIIKPLAVETLNNLNISIK